MPRWWSPKPARKGSRTPQKRPGAPSLLAQDQEIRQLMGWFEGQPAAGNRALELATLVRTALFKSASALVGALLRQTGEAGVVAQFDDFICSGAL